MKIKTLVFVMTNFMVASVAFAATTTSTNPADPACVPGQPNTSNAYQATQWYRDSAERNAIYREVFLLGQQRIKAMVAERHLKPHHWGVVFDIDETLLNNSELVKNETINQCKGRAGADFSSFAMTEVSTALPGAAAITCHIQKMGGYVSLISNRDGTYVDPSTKKSLLMATAENLKKQGICYNQILLATGSNGDKNPRFKAVETGVYPQGMVYSNKLPAHPVIAFFGDNIQDFPNLWQDQMITQNPNEKAYDHFGRDYFALPNPTYGSWQANSFN